jgi:hypothetical protein
MITMVDEIYDRGYQAGRDALHDGVDALGRKIGAAFAPALSAIYHFEWDAPWTRTDKKNAKA